MMIQAQDLTINRGNKQVVKDLSFSVNKGEVFGLLGGNGAGKSTTLLGFLGFLEITSGEAKINGVKIDTRITETRNAIAYLPESANLYPHLTAIENIKYFLSLAQVSRDENEIAQALDQVSLAQEARQKKLSSYSKGMRQKVSIALAILRQSPVLFLDEPTSGLDPVAIDEFNKLVKSLASTGTTVLMVTHDVYGACQIADRIGLLRDGSLVGMFEASDGNQISADEVHKAFTAGAK